MRKYTVTFETDGGSSVSPQETGFIEKEPETKKDNYTFSGWYLDAAFAKKVEFPLDVTENITLYAKWIPVSWDNDYALMIDVEGGTFTMGDADSGNNIKHQVTVSSFRIAAYELTYEIWSEVYSWAINNGYNLIDANKGVTDQDKFSDFEPATKISWNMAVVWLNAYSEMKGLEPVYSDGEKICKNCVTSDDFKVVFDKNANGYRLPTEAEWEFAAGGGNYEYRDDLKYSGDNKIENVAWYMDNSGRETHPVGKKESNSLGIYDMSGNVSEWCWDSLYAYSKDAVTNPINSVMTTEKVIRGGSYCTFSNCNSYHSKYDGLNIRVRNTGKRDTKYSIYDTNTDEYSYKYFVGGIRVAQNAQ